MRLYIAIGLAVRVKKAGHHHGCMAISARLCNIYTMKETGTHTYTHTHTWLFSVNSPLFFIPSPIFLKNMLISL